MTITLRQDQKQIINQLFQYRESNTIISSPSGSGKTYLIAETVRRLQEDDLKPLVIAHTKEIRDQIENRLVDFGVRPETVHILSAVKGINMSLDDKLAYEPTHIIIDEAHHTEAKTYKDFIGLHIEAVVYGFTATPMRNDNKKLSNTYERIIQGLSIKSLIGSEALAPFEYYAPDFGKRSISTIIDSEHLDFEDMTFRTGGYRAIVYKKTLYADILSTYEKHIPNEQVIIFAHSQEAAEHYSAEFTKSGYSAACISHKNRPNERASIIDGFRKGDIKILTNYNMVSEGFDVPDVANVILARPTDSLIQYMQQASRATRYRPGKVAKIFDHANNIARHGALDDSRTWSLEVKDIESREVGGGNIPKELRTKEYRFLEDYELIHYERNKDEKFDEEVTTLLSQIVDSENFEDNNHVRKGLVKIQSKWGITPPVGNQNPVSWAAYMMKKHGLLKTVSNATSNAT